MFSDLSRWEKLFFREVKNIFQSDLAVFLAFLMALVHFLGEELEEYIGGYRDQVVSFTSGVSITYIFVQLLPEFHRIASESTELIFFFPLIGFSSIHLLEKHVARAGFDKREMRKEYSEIHSTFLFFYHGAVGYLVASLIAESTVSGLLFFLPMVLHVAVSSFSINEIHERFSRRNSVKIVLSLTPLLGVVLYNLRIFSSQYFNPVFGTVIGMFFYVVIRDSMPEKDRGNPLEYTAGMVVYLAIILAVNSV